MQSNNEGEYTGLEIAVIGMACHFPDARNIREFWDNIQEGRDSVRFYTRDEVIGSDVSLEMASDPNYVRSNGAEIDDKFGFDAEFFNYTADEALLLDPQVRLAHECVYNALLDAGYPPLDFKGKIGLFTGTSANALWETLCNISGIPSRVGPWSARHFMNKDFGSTHISYKLGLKGPGINVDTACSTSLVAVHMAARSLLLDECDIAVAGGTSVNAGKRIGYLPQEGFILSLDGHCRTFDKDAAGVVAGEGSGMVVLKTLKKAIEDNDSIYAIIKGSAINNDGSRKTAYTAPSVNGQVEVIRNALQFSKVDPESIGFVETHGTGTNLGDQIEIESLKKAFHTAKRHYCYLGALKTNIGHLDVAAGIAGFIKTVLVLKNRVIPPVANLTTVNPHLRIGESPFVISNQRIHWLSEQVRRAGVSSFGIGGTNAHVVLEEFRTEPMQAKPEEDYNLLVISAKTKAALAAIKQQLQGFIQSDKDLDLSDLAYTLQTGRDSLPCREAAVFKTRVDLLQLFEKNDFKNELPMVGNRKIIFAFPGQGMQYVNMGRELYSREGEFRETMEECFGILERITGKDFECMLYPDDPNDDNEKINQTVNSQPILFSFEYALARLVQSWGIRPDALIGHSIGEYVAACLSGVFSLEDALNLVTRRAEFMQQMKEGDMLAVNLNWKEVLKFVPASIAFASINSADHCVLSGTVGDIAAFSREISTKGIAANILKTSHAFHSPMMHEAAELLENHQGNIKFNEPEIPFISNVTGDWISSEDCQTIQYWSRQIRSTVQLEMGLNKVLEAKDSIILELGPGNSMCTFIEKNRNYTSGHKAVSLIRHRRAHHIPDWKHILDKVGEIWMSGVNIEWSRLDNRETHRRMPLPTYPFSHKEFRIDAGVLKNFLNGRLEGRTEAKNEMTDWFYTPTWRRSVLPPAPATVEGKWLVIGRDKRLIGDISGYLRTNSQVTLSLLLTSNARIVRDGSQIEIDWGNPLHYREIMESFDEAFGSLHIIDISFLPYNSDKLPDQESIDPEAYRHLLYLAKAFSALTRTSEVFLNCISIDNYDIFGSERLTQNASVLPAALRVISQEYFFVKSRNIDIPGTWLSDPAILPGKIYDECIVSEYEPVIAVRDNHTRWLPAFTHFIPGKNDNRELRIQRNAVYLITGGAGEIGYILAGSLIKMGATVVITGRSDLNDPAKTGGDQKRRRWERLKSVSPEILYLQADVTDEAAFERVVQTIERDKGSIKGVFHLSSARMTHNEENLIRNLDFENCMDQLSAKTEGVRNIKRIFDKRSPEFIVLFSSISSILGGIGFFAYAPANAYLDRYAQMNDKVNKVRWFSINWDAWRRGDAVGDGPDLAISESEGRQLFSDPGSWLHYFQTIISVHDLEDRLKKWVLKDDTVSSAPAIELPKLERPGLQGDCELPADETEEKLSAIWRDLFGYKTIGVTDDFFELGGDSLKVISLVNLIRRTFGKEISLSDFFANASVRGIASLILAGENSQAPITPAAKKDHYVLSSAQKRLFFLYEFDRKSLAYNMLKAVRIRGKADKLRIERTFSKLIKRHEILRTSIHLMDDGPVQVVADECDFKLSHFYADGSGIEAVVERFCKPFDLLQAPLLRAGIVEVSRDENILLIDMPHIITDGVSQSILIREFMALYDEEVLPELSLDYKDYAEWQQSDEQQARMAKQKDFWLRTYADIPDALTLPGDRPRPVVKTYQGGLLHFEMGVEDSRLLKSLADSEGTTLFMVLLSAYNIFLGKLGSQEDIIIGIPTMGRQHPDIDQMIGMFVNTLTLRNYPKGNLEFVDFLRDVKLRTLSCFDNQDFQYEDLIDALKIERNTTRNALFDVVFVFDNIEESTFGIPGLDVEPYAIKHRTSMFDLTLSAMESGGQVLLAFEYSLDLFERETIVKFAAWFKRIISAIAANARVRIADIGLLSAAEKQSLLPDIFGMGRGSYGERTVHEIFGDRVREGRERIALVYGEKTMSYGELDEKSDVVGGLLRRMGVCRDRIVGLLTERGMETVIGMLGILKAGGAYLPIDVEYPEERTRYLLADSGAEVLVTTQEGAGARYGIRAVELTAEVLEGGEVWGGSDQGVEGSGPGDLCYVVYTSGTTGRPKGVLVEHRQVVRLFFTDRPLFDFGCEDVWTMFHHAYFDFSVWEMYGALLYGGRLVIVPRMVARDPSGYLGLLREQGVTIVNQTPSAFYNLIEAEEEEEELGGKDLRVRYVILGGEALKPLKLAGWRGRHPGIRLINMFGITETTVHVTYKEIGEAEIAGNVSNIGRAIPTLWVYVLDGYGQLVPEGVVGELYVGGAGVSRGYLNRPELTAERFMADPYELTGRVYRSGDLCRRLKNGELEYMGRRDEQVKIRGYRIELGEIESRLLGHGQIRDAVVVVREEGEKRELCAYVVLEGDVGMGEIRGYLQSVLPEYMVPGHIIEMGSLPQTANGKVDRKRLPAPEGKGEEGQGELESEGEVRMREIWVGVLKVERVGSGDNFFSLGGDSMVAIRLINKVRGEWGVKVRIADLFMHQTLKEFTGYVEGCAGLGSEEDVREEIGRELLERRGVLMLERGWSGEGIEDVYPASEIQKGMLYHWMREPGMYHDQMVHMVRYPAEQMGMLGEAVRLLVGRHSILRTAFCQQGEEMLQVVYREIEPEIRYEDIREKPEGLRRSYIRGVLERDRGESFSIEEPGLFRVLVWRLGEERYCMCLVCHHAIIDGWSDAAFKTELNNTMVELSRDASYRPKGLGSSYRDYVIRELSSVRDESLVGYWREELRGYRRFSFRQGDEKGEYREREERLAGEMVRGLERRMREWGMGMKELCLSAFLYTLKGWSYENDILVGMVVNNRGEEEDGDKVLGCFLNTVPFRLEIERGWTWRGLAEAVSGKVKRQKKYEGVPFSRIVEVSGERTGADNPITDMLFNYTDFHIYEDLVGAAGEEKEEKGGEKEGEGEKEKGEEIGGVTRNNSLFNLNIDRTGGGLRMGLNYVSSFADEGTVERFMRCYRRSLEWLVGEPERVIRREDVLGCAEVERVLEEFNDTDGDEGVGEGTILDLLEEQVMRRPEAIALEYEGERVSYGDLERRTNQWVHYLREQGVRRSGLVPVCLERSVEMVMVLLGLMKCGGVYIPIDPDYPADRIGMILEEVESEVVIVSEGTAGKVGGDGRRVLNVDKERERIGRGSDKGVGERTRGEELAYIMYTSGTTGRPKGVMIGHGSLLNFIRSMNGILGGGEEMVMLSVTTYSFDISGLEFYWPLCRGGRLVVAGEETIRDPGLLMEKMEEVRATHMQATPSRWQLLLEGGWENETGTEILCGGEAMSGRLKDQLVGLNRGGVWNLYGPTETTIWSSAVRMEKGKGVTIGRPIGHTRMYILDKGREVLPVGVEGEVYISGAGLSKGYYKRREMTEERFVMNGYGREGHEVMYKTGDMGRWLPTGEIRLGGRSDDQVKIRGYRIEPGEIENVLLTRQDIEEAVVTARSSRSGEKELVAYIVSNTMLKVSDIRSYLGSILPGFMIPSHFVQLESLPLTFNGKIARQKLPDPEDPGIVAETGYTAPANETESKLVAIWQEILDQEMISVKNDFFELGGHSLNATRLVGRIEKEFSVRLSLNDLLTMPILEDQARLIQRKGKMAASVNNI